ncbi:MAG: glycosyltransferase family 4 protein [Porphyromonadaceae bacterium]|nr:glycosyltransferase family 4 protein [Porphyromonadaceae bacterium]
MENRKLKVAMLGHKRVPSREGGIEIVVEELATRMVQQGHRVTCYNRRGCSAAEKNLKEYKGIRLKKVFTVACKGLAAVTASFFATVRAALGRYDVVHFHAEGPCLFLWLPKLFGKRCVATIHGLDWQREKWNGIGSRCILWGERVAVRCADEIIVLSRRMQSYFQETYGRKTVFIPNGVNRPVLRDAKEITEKFGLQKDGYILFLGRIVPEKGLKYLIQAYKGVTTDKKLVIAGGSSDTDKFLKELRQMSADDQRVIFSGFVEGTLLEELCSNAYLYCQPSDLEGMPMSLLEAMSYGNCCVVSDIPECAEVVEDRAVVFKKGNVADLQEKLQRLCDDEKQVTLYKNGVADFVCGKYGWDEVVERTLKVYEGPIPHTYSQQETQRIVEAEK